MSEMQKSSTLSIIIPVYNVNKYVLAAVDSILDQTVLPHEIIIVDDGSTDDSGQLVEEKYGMLPGVKIIHTQNQGLGEARNVGARACSGDFIYYFDSDDLLENDLIESFYNELSVNPHLEIYAFSAESFLDRNSVLLNSNKINLPKYRRKINFSFDTGIEAFNKLSEIECFFPNAWLYIYKRHLNSNIDLSFKPIIHEDEEFTPRLFFAATQTVITDRIFFKRRVRAGSIMQSSKTEKNVVGYIRSIEALESLLPDCNTALSKKYILKRIENNIINIVSIQKNKNCTFSQQTDKEFKVILNKYNSIFIKAAVFNFFLYRMLRLIVRKIKSLIFI